jgi:hypothetical protein
LDQTKKAHFANDDTNTMANSTRKGRVGTEIVHANMSMFGLDDHRRLLCPFKRRMVNAVVVELEGGFLVGSMMRMLQNNTE